MSNLPWNLIFIVTLIENNTITTLNLLKISTKSNLHEPNTFKCHAKATISSILELKMTYVFPGIVQLSLVDVNISF